MDKLIGDKLDIALQQCEKEQIHIPESIQPHGLLFVLDVSCSRFLKVSKNVEDVVDTKVDDFFRCQPNEFFSEKTISELQNCKDTERAQKVHSLEVLFKQKVYDGVAHATDGQIVLELEPRSAKSTSNGDTVLENLESYCIAIQRAASLSELHSSFASNLREVTGFARVMVYQFDPSWNGHIIAEDKNADMDSYLGLNFPASDIPPQARELYKKNLIRIIVDTAYLPIPIISNEIAEENALDMSFCVTRSVSPIHIQYLKNMGVGASMSISIMNNRTLWGLVVCHHDRALFVSYKVRLLCEVMAHMYNARHATIINQLTKKISELHVGLIDDLVKRTIQQPAKDALSELQKNTIDVLNADGLAIFTGDDISTYGDIPNLEQLNVFKVWRRTTNVGSVLATDDIRATLKNAGYETGLTGGALIIPIGFRTDHFACWFREAIVQKVNWGGNPNKTPEFIDGEYRLSPRNSFETYQTEIANKSAKWSDETVHTAEAIVKIIMDSERRQAEELSSAKTYFLSQMSHELRTPLTAMNSIIQILKEENSFAASIKTLIGTLDVSAKTLMELINGVLDLDRVESNASAIEFVEFSPQEIIEEVRSVMSVEASNKGLALSVHCGNGASDLISSDMVKIRQVLYNLVGNAVKFTNKGFVNISCYLGPHKTDEKAAQLNIEISDTGRGIPDEKISTIFDKFIQIDSSIPRVQGGSGLGLTISKSLVELLQGSIDVTSKEGLGTKFTVIIPVRQVLEQNPQQDPPLPVETPSGTTISNSNKNVLLAEDYEGNVVAIVHYLQSRGFTVVIAHNGQEAIDMLSQDKFDLIILDVQMPVMDGITATKLIKEKQRSGEMPETPILGMTAKALKGDKNVCLQAGMDDYISKPLKLEDLLFKMQKLVGLIDTLP